MDDIRSMWTAFYKAKDAIADGERLEYLSWRLYSQKLLSTRDTPPVHANTSDRKPSHLTESASTSTLSSPPMLDMSSSSESIQSCRSRRGITSKQLSQLFQPSQERLEPRQLTKSHQETSSSEEIKTVPSMASLAYSQSVLSLAAQNKTPTRSSISETSPQKPEGLGLSFTRPEPSRSVSFRDVTASPAPPGRGRPSEVDLTSSSTRAVRGFSPSNISVAVNYSSQNLAAQVGSQTSRSNISLHRSSSRLPQQQQQQQNSSAREVDSVEESPHLGWSKASIPRNRMFFIESSTDSEAGSVCSMDSVLRDDELSSSQRSGRMGSRVTFAHTSGEEESEGSIHYYHTDDDYDDEVGDDSEWDDLDEEEDDETLPEPEPELFFDEREVPIRPAITRSHLSSLFLKKLDSVEPSPTPSSETAGQTAPPRKEVKAPANILLDAHVARHYPLQPETPDIIPEGSTGGHNSIDETELSQSIRDNLKLSRDFDLQSLWAVKKSTAPYTRSRSSSCSRQNSQPSSWLHSSEDIFDPLNYHSRGW